MTTRLRLDAYRRLGVANVARVALYRLGLKAGMHPVQRVRRTIGGETFFDAARAESVLPEAPEHWRHQALYFGRHRFPLHGSTPDWLVNPFTGAACENNEHPWWELGDFTLAAGDIKTIWEASRFDWVLAMAQRAARGEPAELQRLNAWLGDWCRGNPCFQGVNWKCGQEASIRVMHLALAARFLGQERSLRPELAGLIEAHVARIAPTMAYAIGQDNNHGTSEALALWVGGLVCRYAGVGHAQHWIRTGRRWLEERVRRLVGEDGCFSQHSLNYHRVLLDTLSQAELWRRWCDMPEFSPAFQAGARRATAWLEAMIDAEGGDGPVIGGNDGANLLPLTESDYRDYRPAVQLASVLFRECAAYPESPNLRAHLQWLGLSTPPLGTGPGGSRLFRGGYAVLSRGRRRVVFRFPVYRFRPRHCDALHVDVWNGAENVLRDAGSYSYNAEPPWQEYFVSTVAHNTVTFDGRDQMPALGRFLRGAWLRATDVDLDMSDDGVDRVAASYVDWQGCRHRRQVQLEDRRIIISDEFGGFQREAVLRWRLLPGAWSLHGNTAEGPGVSLQWQSTPGAQAQILGTGWESRYYLEKTQIPVLEITFRQSARVTTTITFSA